MPKQNPANEHWAVIKVDYHDRPDFVKISASDPQKYYWFGTSSWASGDYEILREWFGDDPDAYELAYYLEYFNDIQAVTEPVQSEGWLAPDGKFFVCQYGQHASLAYPLHARYYNELGSNRELDKHGWAKVTWDGSIYADDTRTLTPEQVSTVAWLRQVGNNQWKDTLAQSVLILTDMEIDDYATPPNRQCEECGQSK